MAKSKYGMKSLARNRSETEVAPSKEPYYPSMTIEESALPELKGVTVGDRQKILIEVSVKGVHKYGNGDTEIQLDIEKGKVVKDADEKSEPDESEKE